ncbi:hypothetical protein F528_2018 [Neisseria meningitidis 992008]|nr:hypothetical protein F528_2018 [Neisseria meningitidis 992008]
MLIRYNSNPVAVIPAKAGIQSVRFRSVSDKFLLAFHF